MNTQLSSYSAEAAGGIPTGFWPKAQGCEERATLGHLAENVPTPTGLRHRFERDGRHNPVGVEGNFDIVTQGSSCLATLGWRTQSRWDCRNAQPYSLAGGAA